MRSWKTALLTVASVTILASGVPAMAQQAPPAGKGLETRFDAMDTNHDGKVSREEFLADAQKRAERMFKSLDENGDGYLTKEEIADRRAKMSNRRMQMKQKGMGLQQEPTTPPAPSGEAPPAGQ